MTTLTNLAGLEAWTQYAQSLLGFSGDPELLNSFNWSAINALTVEDYLELLDLAEQALLTFDWSFLGAQLPFITSILQQQGLPQAEIDQALGLLNDFVSGDVSVLTDGFDVAREALKGFAPSTVIFDAVSGNVTPPSNEPTSGDDVLTGTSGNDKIKALGGNDQIDGKGGDDILIGDAGNDEINGGKGKDKLLGRAGSDDLNGGDGKDKLSGAGGSDDLSGGKGNDIINGGKGKDTLAGNQGNDRFVFKKKDGVDTIVDFQLGSDKIKILDTASTADLTFTDVTNGVLVEAGRLDVLVQGLTEAQLNDAENFVF
ncbi:MAG: calcium-binding protein [Arenibacterium sp.]